MKKIEIVTKQESSGKQSLILIVNDKQVDNSRVLSDREIDDLWSIIVGKIKKEMYRY